MPDLDWSQCPAVESIPGKVSGAWVLKGTRMPVQTIFENLELGMSLQEITETYDVTRRKRFGPCNPVRGSQSRQGTVATRLLKIPCSTTGSRTTLARLSLNPRYS